MAQGSRATHVCAACKSRKRSCDKRLPACGYCARKGRSCQYEYISTPPKAADAAVTALELLSVLTLDERMEKRVQEMLQLIGRSIDKVAREYFTGFQLWLPVVSPTRFYNALIAQQTEAGPPSAALSVLLMAMILITLPPSQSPEIVEILYVGVKTSYTEVQACTRSSLLSLQSGLLITAYEYACERIDSAYLTVGTCTRIAYLLKLDTFHEDTKHEPNSLEKLNVWWGVLILERMIACEMPPDQRRLFTVIPTQVTRWPADFADLPRLSPSPSFSGADSDQSPRGSNDITSYGYHAQAVQMLDDVLALSTSVEQNDAYMAELQRLDKDLTAFLINIMTPSSWIWGIYCGAIGTSMRALFILHKDIPHGRQHSPSPRSETVQACRHLEVLKVITNMLNDIAHLHVNEYGLSHVHTFPLSNPHIFRKGISHLRERQLLDYDETTEKDLQTLASMVNLFHQKWTLPAAAEMWREVR